MGLYSDCRSLYSLSRSSPWRQESIPHLCNQIQNISLLSLLICHLDSLDYCSVGNPSKTPKNSWTAIPMFLHSCQIAGTPALGLRDLWRLVENYASSNTRSTFDILGSSPNTHALPISHLAWCPAMEVKIHVGPRNLQEAKTPSVVERLDLGVVCRHLCRIQAIFGRNIIIVQWSPGKSVETSVFSGMFG